MAVWDCTEVIQWLYKGKVTTVRKHKKRASPHKGWCLSLTQQTWVWANSGRWWRTGKPGVLPSKGLQRVGHNWATEQQLIKGVETQKEVRGLCEKSIGEVYWSVCCVYMCVYGCLCVGVEWEEHSELWHSCGFIIVIIIIIIIHYFLVNIAHPDSNHLSFLWVFCTS